MRVPYITPTSEDFDVIFASPSDRVKGGALSDIRYYRRGRGGSFFGILQSLARRSIPFLRNLVLPQLGEMAHNITKDYSSGVPFKKAVKKSSLNAVRNIGEAVLNRGGRKKKSKTRKKTVGNNRKRKKITRKKKHCPKLKDDIFTASKYML